MADLLIQGGHIIDPANHLDAVADLRIHRGRVAEIGADLKADGAEIFDARGLVVAPGLVDIHVHLREPGFESAETIASGTRAAAAGGVTTVIPIPNTRPVIDSAADIKFIQERAASTAAVHVYPIAAVTIEQKGEEIVEFGDLIHAGAIGFSDDGHPIMNNEIMRRALEYCAMFNAPILDHCGDAQLAADGVMFEGAVSTRLGLRGIPSVAESIQVARDIALSEYTGGRVHCMHISSAASVEFIRHGKARSGVRVTAEVTPHHLALTDEALLDYDTNFKMNPPLGGAAERDALRRALAAGVIDCIATDHAPHTVMAKDKEFTDAPFGVIGLETSFMVSHTEMTASGLITLNQLIERMSTIPARIMGIPKGTLSIGADGDVAILDPAWSGKIEEKMFHSQSRNTPFVGYAAEGRVVATAVKGRVVFREGVVLE